VHNVIAPARKKRTGLAPKSKPISRYYPERMYIPTQPPAQPSLEKILTTLFTQRTQEAFNKPKKEEVKTEEVKTEPNKYEVEQYQKLMEATKQHTLSEEVDSDDDGGWGGSPLPKIRDRAEAARKGWLTRKINEAKMAEEPSEGPSFFENSNY